jgi:predicted nucleotidyltransferase
MPVDLRPRDLAVLEAVFRRYPAVREVRVFGSRATGSAKRASDIDLAVDAPEMSDGEWARLVGDLDEAAIIYAIDAVRLERVPEGPFREKILREGALVYPNASRVG